MKIEVNRPAGTPIGEITNEIRSWLDRNKIEAVDFRTVVGHEGIGFEIRFRTERDAERFPAGVRVRPRSGTSGKRPSATKPPLPVLVGPDCSQEVDLPKGRPRHVAEIEFAVGALPEEKAGQADFAARSDDQIGIRHSSGVKVAGDPLAGDPSDRLANRLTPLIVLCEEATHGIDDFVTSAIRHRNG
jgi:hypothetical protein